MYLPQLDFATYPREIFWAIVVFIIFYFLVRVFVIEKMGRNINNRDIRINRLHKNIRKLDDDITWLIREAEAIKQNASQKARSIIDAARSEMEEAKEKERVNAREDYKRKTEQLKINQVSVTDSSVESAAKAIISAMKD